MFWAHCSTKYRLWCIYMMFAYIVWQTWYCVYKLPDSLHYDRTRFLYRELLSPNEWIYMGYISLLELAPAIYETEHIQYNFKRANEFLIIWETKLSLAFFTLYYTKALWDFGQKGSKCINNYAPCIGRHLATSRFPSEITNKSELSSDTGSSCGIFTNSFRYTLMRTIMVDTILRLAFKRIRSALDL